MCCIVWCHHQAHFYSKYSLKCNAKKWKIEIYVLKKEWKHAFHAHTNSGNCHQKNHFKMNSWQTTNDSSCDVTFLSILKIQNGRYPRFILSSLFWHTCVMCVAMCLLTKRAKNLLFSADLFLFTFKSSYHDDIMLS